MGLRLGGPGRDGRLEEQPAQRGVSEALGRFLAKNTLKKQVKILKWVPKEQALPETERRVQPQCNVSLSLSLSPALTHMSKS